MFLLNYKLLNNNIIILSIGVQSMLGTDQSNKFVLAANRGDTVAMSKMLNNGVVINFVKMLRYTCPVLLLIRDNIANEYQFI